MSGLGLDPVNFSALVAKLEADLCEGLGRIAALEASVEAVQVIKIEVPGESLLRSRVLAVGGSTSLHRGQD